MIFWSTRGRSDGFCWPHFKRAIIFLEWLQNKQFSNIQDSFKNWAPGLLAALKAGGKSCSGADGNSPHITSGEEVLNAIKSLSGGRSWSLLSGSSGHLISGQKVAPAPSGISGHQEACIFSSKSLWNSTCHCRLKQYSLNPFKSMIVVTFCNNHQWYVILESCMATVPARHHRFSGSTFCLKFLDKKLTGHSACCKPRDCWGLAVGASSTGPGNWRSGAKGTAAVGAGGSGGKSSTLFSLLKHSVSWNDTPLQSTHVSLFLSFFSKDHG